MYNFSQKTQSLWFFCYFSALIFVVIALAGEYNFILLKTFTLNQWLLYSGLLFAIGTGFGLGSLDSNERALLWKWKLLWIVFILLGLSLTVDGLISYFYNIQGIVFNSKFVFWQSAVVIGIPLLIYGTILFFSGMSEGTRDSFGKLSIIFFLLAILGFISALLGVGIFYANKGANTKYLSFGIWFPQWNVLIAAGVVLGILGIIPLSYIMGSRESLKDKFHKLWIVWLILALAGVVLYVVTAVEVLGDVNLIGGPGHREGGLILSLAFQGPGFAFLVASTNKDELIKKFSFLYPLLLIVGVAIALASTFVHSLTATSLGTGLALVIIASGLIYKAISLDYTPSASSSVARPMASTVVSGSTSKAGFEIPNGLQPEDKKYYIEMQRKTNENWITLLNNAAKQNRLSKDFVTKKVQELNSVNAQSESIIANIMEEAKRSSRQSIFEQAMGNEPSSSSQQRSSPPPQVSSPPMSPPGPPTSPPQKPLSSGPPMPPSNAPPMPPSNAPPKPPSSSGMPPMPPASSGPPMPPGAGGPPKPPSSGGMPPMPPGAAGPPKPPGLPPMPSNMSPPVPGASQAPAKPPGAPGGDAVNTARSTSIAELRGEMLKELRRLRDIFNDDQK